MTKKTEVKPETTACPCGSDDYLAPYIERAHVRISVKGDEYLEHEDGHEYQGRELLLSGAFCKKCGQKRDLSGLWDGSQKLRAEDEHGLCTSCEVDILSKPLECCEQPDAHDPD